MRTEIHVTHLAGFPTERIESYPAVELHECSSVPLGTHKTGTTPKTCRACNEKNLKWIQVDEAWRLASEDGQIHKCSTWE